MLLELLLNRVQALLSATTQFDKRTSVGNFHASAGLSNIDCDMESNFIMLVMLNDKRS